MVFDFDIQTIKDLELFPEKGNHRSVFDFYNRAKTQGGQDRLYKIMGTPLSDQELLVNRKE